MQNSSHLIEVVFEGALLVCGFFYLVCWMDGRKLGTGQALFLFVIAGLLLLDLLVSLLPGYIVVIGWLMPSLWGLLRRRSIGQLR